MMSLEVPSTEAFHPFSVEGKAPGSAQIEKIIVEMGPMQLGPTDDIRDGGAVKEKLHDLAGSTFKENLDKTVCYRILHFLTEGNHVISGGVVGWAIQKDVFGRLYNIVFLAVRKGAQA